MKHHAVILETLGRSLGAAAQTDADKLYRAASAKLLGKLDPLDQPDPKVRLTTGSEPAPWVTACNTETGLAVQLAAHGDTTRLTISRLLVQEGSHNSTGGCKLWL